MSDASAITAEMARIDERFGRLSEEYEQRREAARAAVVRWEWYSGDAFDLRPLFYERHFGKPGRRLDERPPADTDHERIGFDADGRPVVLEENSGFLGEVSRETFRVHGEGRVEEALYSAGGDPIYLHEYRYEGGRIRSAWMVTANGVTHEEYRYTGESVTELVVQQGGERGRPGERDVSVEPVRTYRASYDDGVLTRLGIVSRDGDDVMTPIYERPPADFTIDAAYEAVRRELVARIPQTVAELASENPAYCVALAYFSEPGPCMVYVGFEDAREELLSTPDGKDWVWNAADMSGGIEPDLSAVEDTARLLFQELTLADADDETARPGTERNRELVCEVAKELNSVDWSSVLPVTDDFVVYATDMELVDLDTNMAYCVPQSLLDAFHSRGLL